MGADVKDPIELHPRWWFGQAAMTIWPFVFFAWPPRPGRHKEWVKAIRAHERHHWEQQRRWYVLPWLVAYLVLLPFYAWRIRQHPMEREGYRIQRAILEAGEAKP